MKIEINDVISLIEQNFNFLHLGKFLSWYIRKNNLADVAETIPIRSDDGEYILYGNRTKMLLEDAFINGYKPNVLGYFTEWNAFRGIFMAVSEGIEKVDIWKSYLEERLGEQYDFFEKIIKKGTFYNCLFFKLYSLTFVFFFNKIDKIKKGEGFWVYYKGN